MPQAKTQPIPPIAKAQQPRPPELPNVATLGGLWAASWRSLRAVEEQIYEATDQPEKDRLKETRLRLEERKEALRAMAFTVKPLTLADAAYSAQFAAEIADDLVVNVHDEASIQEIGSALLRLSVAIIPIIAEAAGLDLEVAGLAENVGLCARRFAGLEAVA